MFRTSLALIAPLALSATLASAAHAGSDQEAIDMCRAEMLTQQPTIENADELKFRSVRGSRVRQLTFEYRTEDGRQRAVCKVKRGEIVDVEWKS